MALFTTWDQRFIQEGFRRLCQEVANTVTPGARWSIVELPLDETDWHALESWLRGVDARSMRQWLLNRYTFLPTTGLPATLTEAPVTEQERAGLMVLASLVAMSRRLATVDALMTRLQQALPGALREVLFSGATLRSALREAIEAAALRFGLRQISATEASDGRMQRWYQTLRLHAGCTAEGIAAQLPHWLEGAGQPLYVQRLLEEPSSGFEQLWTILRTFRRDGSLHGRARVALRASCWFRRHDADDILEAIDARRQVSRESLPERGSRQGEVGPQDADATKGLWPTESLAEASLDAPSLPRPILRWDGDARVLMGTWRMTAEEAALVPLTSPRYEVMVDRTWWDALVRRDDGGYEGTNEEPLPLRGELRVELVDEGAELGTPGLSTRWVLRTGLDVQVFAERTGHLIEPDMVLVPSEAYWLLGPEGARLSTPGGVAFDREGCAVVKLEAGWDERISLLLEGEEVWRPSRVRTPRPDWVTEIRAVVQGDVVQVTPAWATVVSAHLAGVSLAPCTSSWPWPDAIETPVAVLTMHVEREGQRALVQRQIVRRAALLVPYEGGVHEAGDRTMERHQIERNARAVWPEIEHRPRWLLDGTVVLEKLAPHDGRPRAELAGRGERLSLASRPDGRDRAFVSGPVVDHGVLASVVRHEGRIELRRKATEARVLRADRHRLLVWPRRGRPYERPLVVTESGQAAWAEVEDGEVRAVALLSNEGSCLGSHWSENWSEDWDEGGDKGPDAREALLLLRWLKVPVLETRSLEAVRALVRRNPVDTLLAWGRLVLRADPTTDPLRRVRLAVGDRLLTVGHEARWFDVVRSVCAAIDLDPTCERAMYERLYLKHLHLPQAFALVPWYEALTEVSPWWVGVVCGSAPPQGSYERQKQEEENRRGRRWQWLLHNLGLGGNRPRAKLRREVQTQLATPFPASYRLGRGEDAPALHEAEARRWLAREAITQSGPLSDESASGVVGS